MARKSRRRAPEATQGETVPTTPPETTEVPGMKSGTWSGIPMFSCTCGETFFDAEKAKDHTCKEVRYAAEGDAQ